jgi:hypothetical protein
MENLCVRYLTGTTLGVPYKFSEQRSPQRFWNKTWSNGYFIVFT